MIGRNEVGGMKGDVLQLTTFCLEGSFGRSIAATIFCFFRVKQFVIRLEANHFSNHQSRAAQQDDGGEENGKGDVDKLFHHIKVGKKEAEIKDGLQISD